MKEYKSSTHAIFSLGDLHGTSSSISSSDSSPSWSNDSWPGRCNVELVSMSGTGSMLGRLLPENENRDNYNPPGTWIHISITDTLTSPLSQHLWTQEIRIRINRSRNVQMISSDWSGWRGRGFLQTLSRIPYTTGVEIHGWNMNNKYRRGLD